MPPLLMPTLESSSSSTDAHPVAQAPPPTSQSSILTPPRHQRVANSNQLRVCHHLKELRLAREKIEVLMQDNEGHVQDYRDECMKNDDLEARIATLQNLLVGQDTEIENQKKVVAAHKTQITALEYQNAALSESLKSTQELVSLMSGNTNRLIDALARTCALVIPK